MLFQYFVCSASSCVILLTPCISIPQLDDQELLPLEAWLRHNSLECGTGSSSVANSEVQTLLPVFQHSSTCTDARSCSDAATDTAQLQDDCAAAAAQATLEAQEKALLEEQQMMLRSQFDAQVSGYQMQLSEVERAKDTQLCVQTNVVVAMLDMLQLPEDFPPFPESSDQFETSQLQHFLSAFQAHTEVKHREREELQQGNNALQGELADLHMQLQQLRLEVSRHQQDAATTQQTNSGHSDASAQQANSSHSHAVFYADAASEEPSPLTPQQLSDLRVHEQKQFCIEMEERLRGALGDEEQAKRERDEALQRVAILQQEMQTIMQELRERAPPPRHADAAPEAGYAAPVRLVQQQEPHAAAPLSPKHMYRPSPPLSSSPTIHNFLWSLTLPPPPSQRGGLHPCAPARDGLRTPRCISALPPQLPAPLPPPTPHLRHRPPSPACRRRAMCPPSKTCWRRC